MQFTPTEDFYKSFEANSINNGVGIQNIQPKPEKKQVQIVVVKDEDEPPVFDYQMKRFYAAVGFVGLTVCCMFAAERGSFDVAFQVVGWAIAIAIAYAILKKVFLDCFTWEVPKNEDLK